MLPLSKSSTLRNSVFGSCGRNEDLLLFVCPICLKIKLICSTDILKDTQQRIWKSRDGQTHKTAASYPHRFILRTPNSCNASYVILKEFVNQTKQGCKMHLHLLDNIFTLGLRALTGCLNNRVLMHKMSFSSWTE